ncbi:MAG: T9SS type A sorting domain-containing protein [Salinivirgaceae bacterium]|nr:T9SS type A sorting domain-containing protein [Salinivirgaceae bacterium]
MSFCNCQFKITANVFKKRILFALFSIVLCLTHLQAQQAIPASGSNASGSGGTASYTIGQLVYTTNTGTTGSVAQGVQQPYEISLVSGIEQAKGINLKCSAYPNPTADFLNLNIENYNNENLSYQLFDISGNLLENKKLTSNETRIDMNNRIPAIYFLKVIDNQIEIKTFKITKQ